MHSLMKYQQYHHLQVFVCQNVIFLLLAVCDFLNQLIPVLRFILFELD